MRLFRRKPSDKAEADKAKADKAKADKAKAASIDQARVAVYAKIASIGQARAANNDQAKAVNKGKDQDDMVTLVTREQKQEGLKMWKELLIQTKDYRPFQQRPEEENLKEVKVLRSAMPHFRSLRLSGIDCGLRILIFVSFRRNITFPETFWLPQRVLRGTTSTLVVPVII